jgi:hypothetical protein
MMNTKTKKTIKIIGARFIRGAVAGAVAFMVLVMGLLIKEDHMYTLMDVYNSLGILAGSGIMGALSGGLLALDKYFRLD